MLADLDEVDWSGLTHAYGAAEDVPALLRALASGDRRQADEALDELTGSIFHQGTVYPATVPAVPFLVEAARAGQHLRAMTLGLVGMLADPYHAYGEMFPSVRAAVVAQADQLLPLLADPDTDVRAQAAYAVAQCGEAVAVERLRERWAVEDAPQVRASLVQGLGLRDPAGCAEIVRSAVRDAPPPVRVAAALAAVRVGIAWPDGAAEAVTAAFATGVDVDYPWQRHGSGLAELAIEAAADGFAEDLLAGLVAGPEPAVRRDAVWALSERCRCRRSAPARCVPLLGPLLADPDDGVRREAVGALRRVGVAAGRYADRLAQIADEFPQTAGDVAITAETRAVETLVQLADPRWLAPVCQAWAAGHRVRPLLGTPPCEPAVLHEVRRRLDELARGDDRPTGNDRVLAGLVDLVHQWGTLAASAEPELLGVLPRAPQRVSKALAAAGVVTQSTVPHLGAVAESGDVGCAVALWRSTGDAAPLAAAVARCLDEGGWRLADDLEQAAAAGEALGSLVGRLRGHLTGTAARTHPERAVQVAAAHLVWRATGDQAEVLPTIDAVLAAGHTPAGAAAAVAGHLRAPTLAPRLRELLADERARVAAARALWRLGEPVTGLVPVLVAAIEAGYGAGDAVRLLVESEAVAAVGDLTRLAEREQRLELTSIADDLVWSDERLQHDLRAAVSSLTRRG